MIEALGANVMSSLRLLTPYEIERYKADSHIAESKQAVGAGISSSEGDYLNKKTMAKVIPIGKKSNEEKKEDVKELAPKKENKEQLPKTKSLEKSPQGLKPVELSDFIFHRSEGGAKGLNGGGISAYQKNSGYIHVEEEPKEVESQVDPFGKGILINKKQY